MTYADNVHECLSPPEAPRSESGGKRRDAVFLDIKLVIWLWEEAVVVLALTASLSLLTVESVRHNKVKERNLWRTKSGVQDILYCLLPRDTTA